MATFAVAGLFLSFALVANATSLQSVIGSLDGGKVACLVTLFRSFFGLKLLVILLQQLDF